MARRMRELDWGASALGPVEAWPSPLCTSVGVCLNCAFPIVLWWGPELVILYNDEYRAILGKTKHPGALGERGAKVWSEIWEVIEPMLAQVMERGEATRSRDLLLHIDREGYPEEAYFSFSYSPIYERDGTVGGVFCPVIETTEKVIGERRLRTLRDLAARCKGAESESETYALAAGALGENQYDVPFAMIYRIDADRSLAVLEASAGIEGGAPAAPRTVPLQESAPGAWSLGAVHASGSVQTVHDLGEQFAPLPSGAWKVTPHSALALPILLPGQERPRAVLVAAVSPMRALDDDYRTFFGLVATQIASGLADAQAREEERRRAEALAEIDRAKTLFFSNVSHEFRTPLTLMLGPLEDMLAGVHGPLAPEAMTTLGVAQRNALRLLRLVNTLLDFSRIEAGRSEATYEPTDLATFTADLASVFRSAIEKAGLRLVVDCPALPDVAYVDRDMWEKIVLNLLSNAFKFTFEGQISVTQRSAEQGLELSVSDTGVGIAETELAKLFQRFERVKNTRSRTHEGSGIGLALVQELVRLHGGEVSVRSTEGRGTTFVVRMPFGSSHLPAERIGAPRTLTSTSIGATPYIEEALRWLPDALGDDATPISIGVGASDVEPAPELDGTGPGARVLLADDNADMRDYLRGLLERRYRVVAVPNGQAALESIRQEPPDLVLTDVMMPGLDGVGLLAAIRADERTRTLPVVMLSARAGEEARIEGLAAGADDYLIKPFSARELLARVASQLELSRLRRQAEETIRRRSNEIQALIDRAPLGVYLVDDDFRIRHVNAVARLVFGEIPDLVGRDVEQVMHLLWQRHYADEIVRTFRYTLETGQSFVAAERGEFRVDRRVTEYYEWRLDRIELLDGSYGLVCYFRDVSVQVLARKALEDSRALLEEADRRKDEFLATLAHELRNPLAPIRSSLHLLRLATQGGAANEHVHEMMERQVDHMVRLVDDLMEVSRITRGKIELRTERVELAAIVRSAIETSRPLMQDASHRLSVTLPPEPLWLNADSVRLAQVLANLLNNAAKYTPERGEISLHAARAGRNVVISVSDTGVGIPAAMLPRVFDLFTQVEENSARSRGGLGIGLTLVRTLVELHGGSVEAQSAGAGCGCEFSVTLPLAAQSEVSDDPRSEHQVPTVTARRILVVDDNFDAAESLGMLLEVMGADVYTASDGPSALEALNTYHPSVVFLDIGLPGMDGYEVARQARRRPEGGDVVLIALTGWGQEEDRRRSKEAGIDHHLVKPIDIGVLQRVLSTLPEQVTT